MKYSEEYRDKGIISRVLNNINMAVSREYTFMEVCGGHTASIHRFGIPSLLPPQIKLISGPGCPVCVTGTGFIDMAIGYAQRNDVIITTFGDMMRIPGTDSSLEKEKASGADIRVVFSGTEALEIAKTSADKKIVFLGVGFETTAPGTAVTIKMAENERITNFFVLSAHKLMPPAMEAIIKEGVKIDGFICPGHVSAIAGSKIFNFIPEKYDLACVVAGFEPVDILISILILIRQVNRKSPIVEIQYSRAVTEDGNRLAMKYLSEVFEPVDSSWRGLGNIPLSGLNLRRSFRKFNAEEQLPVKISSHPENIMCICGMILRGLKTPADCSLFSVACSPENPVGACMVSNEGACNTWYKYRAV